MLNLRSDTANSVTPVGGGTYGQVCRARDRQNNAREVAVKKIQNVLQSAELAKKTLREVYILKRVRHPNLIHMYDVHFHQIPSPAALKKGSRVQLDAYVVLDLAQGDLWEQTREKPVTPGEVRLVMQGLLEALRFLQEIRVLHRDLKPENILLARGQGGAGWRIW